MAWRNLLAGAKRIAKSSQVPADDGHIVAENQETMVSLVQRKDDESNRVDRPSMATKGQSHGTTERLERKFVGLLQVWQKEKERKTVVVKGRAIQQASFDIFQSIRNNPDMWVTKDITSS